MTGLSSVYNETSEKSKFGSLPSMMRQTAVKILENDKEIHRL